MHLQFLRDRKLGTIIYVVCKRGLMFGAGLVGGYENMVELHDINI